jgi:hypothetical protein
MKHLLLIITLLAGTIANASVTKPLPWDKPIIKTVKVFSPISELDIWYDYATSTYGSLWIMVKRPYAYTTCEYTTVSVKIKAKIYFGWPRTAQWVWTYIAISVTIPANQDTGFAIYDLREGEEVNVNDYVSDGYLDYCY